MAMPVIPRIGGKRRLADVLIPRFPLHTCSVEVFAGRGGTVLHAVACRGGGAE